MRLKNSFHPSKYSLKRSVCRERVQRKTNHDHISFQNFQVLSEAFLFTTRWVRIVRRRTRTMAERENAGAWTLQLQKWTRRSPSKIDVCVLTSLSQSAIFMAGPPPPAAHTQSAACKKEVLPAPLRLNSPRNLSYIHSNIQYYYLSYRLLLEVC